MPVTDPNSFVLGSGGANWGLPTSGWWNNKPPPATGGLTGSGPVTPGGGYRVPSFDYSQGVAKPTQGLTDLTNYINELNRVANDLANKARIPEAGSLEAQSSKNIGSELQGEVPADVLRLLQRQAAERGVSTGAESPNTTAAYLQALGITSLDQMKQGQADLTAAYARNPAAPLFDPTTQLLTPGQAADIDLRTQQLKYEAELQAKQLELERERLALQAAQGGSGGTRYVGTPRATTTQTGFDFNPASRTYAGPTAADLAATMAGNPTTDWWSSIGYGEPSGTVATATPPGMEGVSRTSSFYDPYYDLNATLPGGSGGTTYTGSTFGGLTPTEFYDYTGLTPEDYSALNLTPEDIFGQGG